MADQARSIRVGIIGTGFAAAAHADALRRLPNVELVGIASRTPARAATAAKELGAGRAYNDAAALIADAEIDAVHICTINRLHSELSTAALLAGKHVLTEKPLATDSRSTEALAALASEAFDEGILTGVCFNYRHYRLIQRLREVIASGQYGSAHFVHGSYLQDWLLYDTDWNWRLDPDDNGASRAVADIGSHWLDLVQFVTGRRIREVFADLATHHSVRQRPGTIARTFEASGEGNHMPVPIASEDYGTVLVRFDGGARGAFALSQVSPGRKNRLVFQVDTSEAGFAWNQEQPDLAWIGRRRHPTIELPGRSVDGGPAGRLPEGHPEGWRDALRNLFEDFYRCVGAHQDGSGYAAGFATFADGHYATLLVEAITESHRSGRWIQVADRLGARV